MELIDYIDLIDDSIVLESYIRTGDVHQWIQEPIFGCIISTLLVLKSRLFATFYGPVPQGSELQNQMLHFRKQVELAFAQESNQLDSVMRHKKVPVQKTVGVRSFFIMRDLYRLIERVIKYSRDTLSPKDYVGKIK